MFVQVEHGNGAELGGHAAGLGNVAVHGIHQCLNNGVVGGVQMIRQGKGTIPVAVVGLVTRGRHYPVIPAHVAKVHVQRVAPAVAVAFTSSLLGAPLGTTGQRVTFPIVAEGDQEGA